MPGGVTDLRIPMFKNLSHEVGIENYFTNALIDEVNHSRVAKLNPYSEYELLGTIESVRYISSGIESVGKIGKDELTLNRENRVVIVINVTLKKRYDESVIWSNKFTGERAFAAAMVKAPVLSGVNPLYNLSARRRNIAELALDIIAEAADKMTEQF